jgi:hypothetical protein
MAKFKFAARLYENITEIQAMFRAHQSTILQLATRHKVGQETMRQFLISTMDDYHEVVQELREMLRLRNNQSILRYRLREARSHFTVGNLTRRKADFSAEELKELQRRIEQRSIQPPVPYHGYIVNPLVGDID